MIETGICPQCNIPMQSENGDNEYSIEYWWECECDRSYADDGTGENITDYECTDIQIKETDECVFYKKVGVVKAKITEVKRPFHNFLIAKTLLLGEILGTYNLLGIKGYSLSDLCKWVWENDRDIVEEYETLEEYIEEVNFGNDGFGFEKEEIEILD